MIQESIFANEPQTDQPQPVQTGNGGPYARCKRCRRPLKNPVARALGYGKICAGFMGLAFGAPALPKVAGATDVEPGQLVKAPTEPNCMDVVLRRAAEGEPFTNVPHTVIWHSPTGFEWGYGGSGPADLALNILNQFVPPGVDLDEPEKCFAGECSRFAAANHQDFKFQFIASMPKEGGTIKAEVIKEWIYARVSPA